MTYYTTAAPRLSATTSRARTHVSTQCSSLDALGLVLRLRLLSALGHGLLRRRRLRRSVLLLLCLLRLRALLDLAQRRLARSSADLRLLEALLFDQLERRAHNSLGRRLRDLALRLLLRVLEGALLVHPTVEQRPCDLPRVELLVEVGLRLAVDEQERLRITAHELDAVARVDTETAVRADLRLHNHGRLGATR